MSYYEDLLKALDKQQRQEYDSLIKERDLTRNKMVMANRPIEELEKFDKDFQKRLGNQYGYWTKQIQTVVEERSKKKQEQNALRDLTAQLKRDTQIDEFNDQFETKKKIQEDLDRILNPVKRTYEIHEDERAEPKIDSTQEDVLQTMQWAKEQARNPVETTPENEALNNESNERQRRIDEMMQNLNDVRAKSKDRGLSQ